MGEKRVRDVLWRDVANRIETVVKVYDTDHLAEDLREFVIKGSLAGHLDEFFGEFAASLSKRRKGADGGDQMAVWIDGFFGSGKSHIAKVIGHVLENRIVDSNGNAAVDLFAAHLEDPKLPHGASIKRHLKQIRDHAWCKTVAFEIRAHVDLSSDSLTAAVQSQFYESIAIARTPWVARLEMWLQAEGQYDAFVESYERENGEGEWRDDRRTPSMYEDEIADAIAEVRAWDADKGLERLEQFQADASSLTPAILIDEILRYLEVKHEETQKEPHLVFVIDEMGQFIADEKDRIEELRSLVELAGAMGKGRVWFICTSQEALDKVVDRTGLQLSNLGKLDARFGIKMALTGEDVLEVVYDRVLRKKEAEIGSLRELYRGNEGQVVTLARLNVERRLAEVDEGTFVSAYPFLPHLVPLAQALFNAIRGYKLSGGERNMIDLAQDVAAKLADEPLGAVASIDMAFDVFESELSATDYLGGRGMQLVREADQRVQDTPLPASRVLKALWMVQRENWVPRTPETLAKLLVRSLNEDIADVRTKTKQTLDRLRATGYVGYDDSTSQYRFLSEEERGLEEDIADEIARLGIGPAKRRAERLLTERVLTKSKLGDWLVPLGTHGQVGFTLRLDGVTIGGSGALTLEAWSPLEAVDLEDVRRHNLAESTHGRTLRVLPDDGSDLVEELKRLEGLDRVASSSRWRDDQSEETIRLLKAKERERAALESRIAAELEKRLRRGRVLYSGDEADLDGTRTLADLVVEFLGVVAQHIFYHHDKADKSYNERNLTKYLRSSGKLAELDPQLGLFDAQDQLLKKGPLVEAIFDELERRKDEQESLEGQALIEHFEGVPYGWPAPLTRLVLAGMLRGGSIYVQSSSVGEPIYDPAHGEAEQVFTATTKFKKARFVPIEGALAWDEIRRAKAALVDLGRADVGDAATELAGHVRGAGEDLLQRATRIQTLIESGALPIRADFSAALREVKLATEASDPVSCVRRFVDAIEAWKQLRTAVAELELFFEQGHDRRFLLMDKLVAKSRHHVDGPLEGPVAEYDAIVAAQNVATKWPRIVEASVSIIDVFQASYSEVRKRCHEAVSSARQRLEASPTFLDLPDDAKQSVTSEFFGRGGALHLPSDMDLSDDATLDRASDQHSIQALETMTVAAPNFLQQMLDRCAQLRPHEPGGGGTERGTVTLMASNTLFGRRFEDAEQLTEVLEDLRSRAEDALPDSDVVFE